MITPLPLRSAPSVLLERAPGTVRIFTRTMAESSDSGSSADVDGGAAPGLSAPAAACTRSNPESACTRVMKTNRMDSANKATNAKRAGRDSACNGDRERAAARGCCGTRRRDGISMFTSCEGLHCLT